MKYIQKDIHYSITKKEQGILKIRRKYNNLSGCRTLSLFTYTTFYVFSNVFDEVAEETTSFFFMQLMLYYLYNVLVYIL